VTTIKRQARVAGVLYFLVAISAPIGLVYVPNTQRARFYRLTAAGKARLSREQDRWSHLFDAIGRIMTPVSANKE